MDQEKCKDKGKQAMKQDTKVECSECKGTIFYPVKLVIFKRIFSKSTRSKGLEHYPEGILQQVPLYRCNKCNTLVSLSEKGSGLTHEA